MSLEEMYNKHRPEIIARNVSTMTRANGTPEQIDCDGRSQIAVARQDETVLVESGMDSDLITDVEETLVAYVWVSSLADIKIAEHHEDSELYKKMKAQAYELRRLLFKYGKFGCKKNKLAKELAKLKEIIEGTGDEDLIRDMLQLYQLFTQSPNIPEGLKQFDFAWVDDSLAMHKELGDLRAAVKNPDVDSEISALEREAKQAYDLYYEKVSNLREWGQFVFEGTDREVEYRPEYLVERGKKGAKVRQALREAAEE